MAISFSTPFTFTPSTTISSSEVNQNFSYIKNKFDGVEALTSTWSNLSVDTVLRSAGTIQSADGLVSAPGVTFTNDTDCGLYRIGANNVAISAGNTKVIDMKTTGVAVLGTTTNDSAAATFMGEYIEASGGASNAPATTQYGDLTSISLTAGDWDVEAGIYWDANGATWSGAAHGISTTTGNSSAGLTLGSNLSFDLWANSATTPLNLGRTCGPHRMSLAATTTVYYKYRAVFSAGTPQATGRISARRVR